MKNVFLTTAIVLLVMTSGIASAGNFGSAGSSSVQEKEARADAFKGAQQTALANGATEKGAKRAGQRAAAAAAAAVREDERNGQLGVWVSDN